MYDLHCHILPRIDDGAVDVSVTLAMAEALTDQGVHGVACTPHILPGVYSNSGSQIRSAVVELQQHIAETGSPLRLFTGADNHIVPEFVSQLRSGHLLSLADSRYVLVEPPHRFAPPRIEELFFQIAAAGYVPILTHPERLRWIEERYDALGRMASRGVWMQITSGSLLGRFGRRPKYWAERLLAEGKAHLLASDAHDVSSRPPDLADGYLAAERLVGAAEARHLVETRPSAILGNMHPEDLAVPSVDPTTEWERVDEYASLGHSGRIGLAQRLRRLFA